MNIPNRKSSGATNPVELYIEWSGSKGIFQTWNKETKKNEEIKMPFSFLFLAEMACITGFNDSEQSGYYSNEVSPYSLRTDKFIVKLQRNGHVVAEGLYRDIKGSVNGGKYTKSIYALAKIDGEYKIVNIKLSGSGFGNLGEIKDKTKGALSVGETQEGKKGATKYFSPVFKLIEVSDDAESIAMEATEKVMDYLKSKGSKIEEKSDEPYVPTAADFDEPDEFDPLPF